MRKPRRAISSTTKHFHIESDVSAKLGNISREEAFEYQTLVGAVATICGYDLLFWSIHPRGIHLLIKIRPLKARETHSTEMVEAYQAIGEDNIAASLTSELKLDTVTHERLLRYRANYGDLQRFVQSVKQRISTHYNKLRARTGPVWQDRAKVFHLQNRTKDLIEVVGYIFAKTASVTGDSLNQWPTPLQEISEANTCTRDGLNQLFKSDKSHAELIEFLNGAQNQVISQLTSYTKNPSKSLEPRRGRIPAWRPQCEREQAETELPTVPSITYKKTRQQAHARFRRMLKRYRTFQQKTGLDRMPHGYKDDPELRKWATALRGKYNKDRLPEWQVQQLEGNSILLPPMTKNKTNKAPTEQAKTSH
ncbi:MAG: hypothetical protein ACI8Z5_001272 [Lentimonas sp.]|jgi:hypothetical protein